MGKIDHQKFQGIIEVSDIDYLQGQGIIEVSDIDYLQGQGIIEVSDIDYPQGQGIIEVSDIDYLLGQGIIEVSDIDYLQGQGIIEVSNIDYLQGQGIIEVSDIDCLQGQGIIEVSHIDHLLCLSIIGVSGTDYLLGLSIIGVQQIDRVVEVVDEAVKGHSVRLLGQKKDNGKRLGGARLDLPKIRKNPLIEIISINTGCLNACTYCKTKHARGDLASYPIEELVERARQSFLEGVCEIWLTSEDTGAYGRDIGTDLPSLLWRLVEVIPEGAMLRLGMTNPPYILEHLEEMAKILSHPRVYAFLHVPVQSGSDSVLMDMKREYCVADFRLVVDFLKDKVPGITIATDIICGFPGETDADFQETLALVERYRFPSLFINQFYPRPGTPAAKYEQVPAHVKKQRTKELSQLFHSYNPYDHKVGERQQVLVTEESFDAQFYVAHNKYYEQVLVPKTPQFKGKMIEVDVYESGKHFLKGRPVDMARVLTASIARPLEKGAVSGLTQEFGAPLQNGVHVGPPLSTSQPWTLDREALKMLSVGLILLSLIVAFAMEKLQ
ncbi:threonylcarbamoyladenosine tRNA methylthiotransferase isoform X2 [Anguilla rostrata]|uniref:threonylcarbamoyladenosine tRNA methylthiotransferase isoform X2 n=1 Tax=Anguilla rostrata TaxID=7938 RepID=UPI0030CC5B85